MRDKEKVLLVSCGGLGNGGVQAIMMGLVRSLSDRLTFDIIVFTSEIRHYDEEFLSYGGEIIRIPHYEGTNKYIRALDNYTRDTYIYQKVKRSLKNRGPYLAIHCNKEYESAPILKAAYDSGIKVRICHNHVVNKKSHIIYNLLNRIRLHYINKYATLKIGCSEESCRSIYDDGEYIVFNNFYDDNRFSLKNYSSTNKSSTLTIVQVGALSSNKNQIFSIKVLSELIKCGIEAKLNIIGFELEKTYRDKILKEIEVLELSSYVSLLPGDSDIPRILSESDIFLMPSIKEGFGIALIEAQAMGLRCYASSSIPSTTNCGGTTYLDLHKGAQFWATLIIGSMQKTDGTNYNTDKFKLSNISSEYYRIYTNK